MCMFPENFSTAHVLHNSTRFGNKPWKFQDPFMCVTFVRQAVEAFRANAKQDKCPAFHSRELNDQKPKLICSSFLRQVSPQESGNRLAMLVTSRVPLGIKYKVRGELNGEPIFPCQPAPFSRDK